MAALNLKKIYFWQFFFPAGLLFAGLCQVIATRCGIGLTNDSYLFLEGIDFFKGTGNLAMTEYTVFQAKPPLFSFFLALMPLPFIHFIFTFILAATLFIWAKIIDYIISAEQYKVLAFLAIASFTPFIMVHVYLWTEPLFMLLLAGSLWLLITARQEMKPAGFIVLVLMGVALILTRHVGLYIVLGIGLALFTSGKNGKKFALTYLIAGILIFLLWNFMLMQEGIESRLVTLKSPVSGGGWSRLDNIGFYLDAVSKWLLPNSAPEWLRLSMLILVLIFIPYALWKLRKLEKFPAIKSLLIISATYYVLMHIAFKIDPFSAERYMMPIFPIAIIIVFWIVEQWTVRAEKVKRYIIIIAIVWLAYPMYRSVKNAIFWHEKLCTENVMIVPQSD